MAFNGGGAQDQFMGGAGGGAEGFGGGDQGGAGRRPFRHDTTHVEGKLFLGGLDTGSSPETVTAYCQQWGQLSDIAVMAGRGFGFVTFADPKAAQHFLDQHDHVIDGKRVEAKAAVPKTMGGSGQPTNKMFVGGTPYELTDDEFRNHFAQYGEIQDAVIVRRPDGSSRCFGFVTYKDTKSVEKCLVTSHVFQGRTVEVKRAVPREAMDQGTGRGGPSRGGYNSGFGGGGGGGGGAGGYGGGSGGYGGGSGGYGGSSGGYGRGGGMGGGGGAGAGGYGAGGGGYGGAAAAAGGYGQSGMGATGFGGMGNYGMGYGMYGAYGMGMMGSGMMGGNMMGGGYGAGTGTGAAVGGYGASAGGYGGGYGAGRGSGGAAASGGRGAGAGAGAGGFGQQNRYRPY